MFFVGLLFILLILNAMSEIKKDEAIASAKGLAKWFSLDVTIKIFGVTIWEYHFPPKND